MLLANYNLLAMSGASPRQRVWFAGSYGPMAKAVPSTDNGISAPATPVATLMGTIDWWPQGGRTIGAPSDPKRHD